MDRLHRYTCDEALRRLEDFLDGELTRADLRQVRDHLDACVPCTSQFAFEAAVLRRVREKLQRTDLPPGLLTRIRAMLGGAA